MSRPGTTLYVTGFGHGTRARDLAYEFERYVARRLLRATKIPRLPHPYTRLLNRPYLNVEAFLLLLSPCYQRDTIYRPPFPFQDIFLPSKILPLLIPAI